MGEKVDYQDIVTKIDLELASLQKEKENINASVEQDLQMLLDDHFKKKNINSFNSEDFKKNHFELLKERKTRALSKAIDKLESLRKEITTAFVLL